MRSNTLLRASRSDGNAPSPSNKRRKGTRQRAPFGLENLETRVLLSTYYVANSGSDSAAGSSASPWSTLQKAANSAKAGDTVVVEPGNYAGLSLSGTGFGGTASAPITFIANTGDWHTSGVNITSPASGLTNAIFIYQTKGYMTFEGFNVSGISGKVLLGNGSPGLQFLNNRVIGGFTPIFSDMCPGIVVSGNTVSGATDEHGIYVNGSDGYTISYNVSYGNNWDGIHTNIQDNTVGSVNNNGLIIGNVCYNNGEAGMDLTSISNSTIENNLCYGNATHGIVLQDITAIGAPPCHDNVIANNTFDASAGEFGLAFGGPDYAKNSVNTTIFNNIAFGADGGIGLSSGSGSLDSTAKLANNITTKSSSLFVSSSDYHLKSGSSAIDAGVGSFNGKAAPSTDKDGQPRPQGATWDIGAYEFTSGADTAPPVISNVAASGLTSIAATVTWTTNEASDTQVQYGTTTSYGSTSTLNASLLTGHVAALAGLTPSTTYHYRVLSRDAAGNLAASGDFTFTTSALLDITPPVISSVLPSSITSSGATVSWTTNENSDTQVQYGTTTSYGSTTTLNSSLVTNHSAGLAGLSASTTYHYRVLSRDAAGNLATSGDFTFVTSSAADTTPPVISSVAASGITSSNSSVSWTTNESSNSQVEYGLTTAYGSSTALNSSLVTSHNVALAGLQAGTTYHYRVKSTDAAGNLAVSGDFSFTTAAAGSSVSFWSDSDTPAVTADNDTNALEVGMKFTSSVSGQVTGVRFYKGAGNTGTHVGHLWDANGNLLASVTFSGESAGGWQQATFSAPVAISANTTYVVSYYAPAGHYAYTSSYFASADTSGPLTAPSGANGVYIYGSGGGFPTSSFSSRNYWVDVVFTPASADTTPPVLSSVTSSAVNASGATINWTTTEASTSQVAYGTSSSYGQVTTLSSSLVNVHGVSLSGLLPNTLYHFQVMSRDAAGNLSVSADMTFTTAKKNADPRADVNHDMVVDVADMTAVANDWQDTAAPGTLAGDVNGDGVVNITDLTLVANSWQMPVDPASVGNALPDTTAPTAQLNAPAVNTAGDTVYTFTVTYTDDVAVNVGTVDANDIQVTGPNGFNQTASFVAIDNNTNGPQRTVTYAILPPSGAWSSLDNGSYTIAIQPSAVVDTSNNPVAASVLGTLTVNIA